MHKRGSLKHPFTRWPIDIFLYLNGRLLNGSCLFFSAGNLLEKFKNVCFLKDDVGHDDSAKLNRFTFFKNMKVIFAFLQDLGFFSVSNKYLLVVTKLATNFGVFITHLNFHRHKQGAFLEPRYTYRQCQQFVCKFDSWRTRAHFYSSPHCKIPDSIPYFDFKN